MDSWPIIITDIKEPEPPRSCLPDIPISSKFKAELDKGYAEFITELYLCAKRRGDLRSESREWFLTEIAVSLSQGYPHLTRLDILDILRKIERYNGNG